MNQGNDNLATEVIRQAKEKEKKWFVAWLVTATALIITAWMRRR